MVDVFGTMVFTGAAVLALGSYFRNVFGIFKERTRGCGACHERHADIADKKKTSKLFERSLNASSMPILIGGYPL